MVVPVYLLPLFLHFPIGCAWSGEFLAPDFGIVGINVLLFHDSSSIYSMAETEGFEPSMHF